MCSPVRVQSSVVTAVVRSSRHVDCVWNVMAHAQKPEFVFRRNGRVNLNRRVRQFSRLLAAEVRASALVMLDTPCSEVVWRVLATHYIHQFPLHFSSRASPCAITFQMGSTKTSSVFLSWQFSIFPQMSLQDISSKQGVMRDYNARNLTLRQQLTLHALPKLCNNCRKFRSVS